MKYLMLLLLFISLHSHACLIQFQVKTVQEEEQVKGPLKRIVTLKEDHSIDADSLVRISFDLNAQPVNDNIIFHFKNKTILNIGYNEDTLKDVKRQFAKCKAK